MRDMSRNPSGLVRCALLAAGLFASFLVPARAADGDYDGNWHFTLTPYLWLAGVTGDFEFTPPRFPNVHANVSVDEGPIDVLKHLHFGLMGAASARKDNWSAFTDMMYVSLGGDRQAVRTVTGPLGIVDIPVDIGSSVALKEFVTTNGIGYSIFHDSNTEADVFAGFRYVGLSADLDWRFSTDLNLLPRTGHASGHSDFWDGLIGVRGRYGFAGTHWFAPFYADIGTGSPDFTTQVSAGGGYAFPWGDVGLMYRYLYFSGSNDKVASNLSLHGVLMDVTFHI